MTPLTENYRCPTTIAYGHMEPLRCVRYQDHEGDHWLPFPNLLRPTDNTATPTHRVGDHEFTNPEYARMEEYAQGIGLGAYRPPKPDTRCTHHDAAGQCLDHQGHQGDHQPPRTGDPDMSIRRKTKASLTGEDDLTVEDLRSWLEGVPGRGIIRLTEAKSYPGEHGVPPWRLDVQWTEETNDA